jgi:hypothetical protein
MRFNSRPYFLAAALLMATVAHAQSGGTGMGQGRVDSDPSSRTAEPAPAPGSQRTYADSADAPAAPSHPEPSAATQPADHAAKRGRELMVAPAPQDPEQQRIWTAP